MIKEVLMVIIRMIWIGMRRVVAKDRSRLMARYSCVVLAVLKANPCSPVSLHDLQIGLNIKEEVVNAVNAPGDLHRYRRVRPIVEDPDLNVVRDHKTLIQERLESSLVDDDGVAEFVPAVTISGRQGAGAS